MDSKPKTSVDDGKAIHEHLYGYGNEQRLSSFVLALRDARALTGRDTESGQSASGQSNASWPGAICYLLLLDQIGSCFAKGGLCGALRKFGTVDDNTIDAIYALRCALVHDFSVVNVPGQKHKRRAALTHHFFLHNDPTRPGIVVPQQRWDGDAATRFYHNATSVNLVSLGDLVEAICAEVRRRSNSKELFLYLAGGPVELRKRYSLQFRVIAHHE